MASIALLSGDEVFVVDATPDLRQQLDALRDVRRPPPGRVDRTPLSGVLLTHAHIGHYLGLAWLGFEAISAEGIPLHATPKMNAFVRDNAPWDQLVELGNVRPVDHPPESPYALAGITVTPIVVPHRDEYADTVAYRFDGPRRSVLYMPDTEPFDRWTRPLESVLEGVDVALVDGTFYSGDELPGRPVAEIGHPLVVDTMDRLQPLVDAGRLDVYFTHFNHSNPAVTPGSEVRRSIEARGFGVLEDGDELPL